MGVYHFFINSKGIFCLLELFFTGSFRGNSVSLRGSGGYCEALALQNVFFTIIFPHVINRKTKPMFDIILYLISVRCSVQLKRSPVQSRDREHPGEAGKYFMLIILPQ